jgi:RNA polymerase sigma-70 factor, ECF subfamily
VDTLQHAAFSEQVLRHVDALYRFARLLTRDPAWAEDLVQQAILQAFEKADQLRSEGNCRGWLFAILRNLHRMALRRQHGRRAVEGGPLDPSLVAAETELYPPPLTPEALVQRELTCEAIEDAISELPALYREVLILVDLEGLRYGEASLVLECGVGTIKSRLYRARNRLRTRLAAGGVVEPLVRRAR